MQEGNHFFTAKPVAESKLQLCKAGFAIFKSVGKSPKAGLGHSRSCAHWYSPLLTYIQENAPALT